MKITAISGRGSKKDFIDLHFISRQQIQNPGRRLRCTPV